MKESLLKRARCRLRKFMSFPNPRKTSTDDKPPTRHDQQVADFASVTTITTITATNPKKRTNRLRKLVLVVSRAHRRRDHDQLAPKQHRDVRNDRSIDVSHTEVFTTPFLGPTLGNGLSFLLMPPEIRNDVYHYLLPEVTKLRDVTGLLCACKQIRQELSSMIVAESQVIMKNVVQKSIALCHSTHPTTEAVAVIDAPQIQTYSHLRNVNVRLGIYDTYSQPADTDELTVDFDIAFSYFNEILSLHLPYVTIDVPATIGSDASIADPELRRRLLEPCILTFRRLEETAGVTLNAQHVIFEIAKEMWDTAALAHPPIVVFVRRITKRNKIKFDLLWYDPRKETQPDYGDLAMMTRLDEVVKKSREVALGEM